MDLWIYSLSLKLKLAVSLIWPTDDAFWTDFKTKAHFLLTAFKLPGCNQFISFPGQPLSRCRQKSIWYHGWYHSSVAWLNHFSNCWVWHYFSPAWRAVDPRWEQSWKWQLSPLHVAPQLRLGFTPWWRRSERSVVFLSTSTGAKVRSPCPHLLHLKSSHWPTGLASWILRTFLPRSFSRSSRFHFHLSHPP